MFNYHFQSRRSTARNSKPRRGSSREQPAPFAHGASCVSRNGLVLLTRQVQLLRPVIEHRRSLARVE